MSVLLHAPLCSPKHLSNHEPGVEIVMHSFCSMKWAQAGYNAHLAIRNINFFSRSNVPKCFYFCVRLQQMHIIRLLSTVHARTANDIEIVPGDPPPALLCTLQIAHKFYSVKHYMGEIQMDPILTRFTLRRTESLLSLIYRATTRGWFKASNQQLSLCCHTDM